MADQPMESPGYPDAPLSEARSPVERLFRSPRATHMVRGVGFVADEPLIEAARYNRRVAIRRAIEASWPAIPSFRDVMQMPDGTNLDGTPVAAVHGDADFGNQGAQRQTYEGGLEDYLEQLANSASSVRDWDHSLVSHPSPAAFPRPFRPPSYRLRLMADSAVLERRAYLAPAWASGLTRAPMHFNLSRWLPKTPAWWVDNLPVIETPFAVSYVASALLNDTNAAWSFVYDELHSFVLAAWVYALHHDGIFARMSAEQLEAFNSLGTNGLESEEDGDVRRDTFHKMCQAHHVFSLGGYY
ncbi:hypothetical protein MMPV_006875 [Pyropia vietnamensis]